jgi:predicted RNA-binding Zn ribbon-like protein
MVFNARQGESRFLWVGNHPATDLCNTAPMIGGQRVELLTDLRAVVRWARTAEVSNVGADELTTRRETITAFVRQLREAVRAVLEAGSNRSTAAVALNELLAGERAALHVDAWDGDGVKLCATRPDRQLRIDIAAAVVDIFRHDPARLHRCANAECVLLYLDISKGGRRRWCDMTTCGNRAKAAAHHARTHVT